MQKRILWGIAAAGIAVAPAQEVYSTWAQHKYVALDTRGTALNAAAPVQNIPILVRLDATNFNAGFAQSIGRGADVRFTKNGDAIRLPHQIETWDSAGKLAEIWVKMDSVRGNNLSSFRMHWGKAGAADSSRGRAVFDTAAGFQAVYHLGEATDSLARDATVNNYSGTPGTAGAVGNPQDTVGVIGRAKSFRGGTATTGGFYALTGTAGGKLNFPAAGPFTLSGWMRAYNNTFSAHIISKGEPQYSLAKRATGSMWEIKSFEDAGGAAYLQNQPVVAGTWQHVVGVRDGITLTLYVDGAALVTDALNDGATITRTTVNDVNLGRDPNGDDGATPNRYYPGAMDEAQLSNVARSESWVRLSYGTQKPGARAALTDTMPIPLVISGETMAPAPGFFAQRTARGMLFRLPEGSPVGRLTLLDARGRTVWGIQSRAGDRTLEWNGLTSTGAAAGAGVYVARFIPAQGGARLETVVTLTR
jgi:hypothetical protein